MPATREVMNRIRTARRKRPDVVQPFIIAHPQNPKVEDGVLCKLCASQIRGWIADDRYLEVTVIRSQTLRTQRLIMASLSNYQEVEMTFDDGSKHVTSTCRSCANKMSLEDAEVVYSADMNQARIDEAEGKGDVRWELWENRQVTEFKLL